MRRLVLVGAVGFVSACGSPPTEPLASRDISAPSASPTSELSCGAVALKQGEQLTVVGASARACLEKALREGHSARLTVTEPTIEGDPIVTTWLLAADGTLRAEVDASKDRYAGSPVSTMSCGRITQLPDPLRCEPSE